MARKFIVTSKRFMMGNVEFHSELARKINTKEEPVLGGGKWDFDEHRKELFLWGLSTDFGQATPEQIKTAIESDDTFISIHLEGFAVLHSPVCDAITLTSPVPPERSTFTQLTTVRR
jgi:hypothetical protein